MPGVDDSIRRQLSDTIATKRWMAAMLNSTADQLQQAFDAMDAERNRADELERKYKDKCAECEQLKREKAEVDKHLEAEHQRPLIQACGNAQIGKIIRGDVHEYYGENNCNQGQHYQRVSAGGQTYPLFIHRAAASGKTDK